MLSCIESRRQLSNEIAASLRRYAEIRLHAFQTTFADRLLDDDAHGCRTLNASGVSVDGCLWRAIGVRFDDAFMNDPTLRQHL